MTQQTEIIKALNGRRGGLRHRKDNSEHAYAKSVQFYVPYFEMLIYEQIKCWRNFTTVHGWTMFCSDHANAGVSQPRCWIIFHASACYITDFYLFIYFAYPFMFYLRGTKLLVRAPWTTREQLWFLRHRTILWGRQHFCCLSRRSYVHMSTHIRLHFLVFLSHSKQILVSRSV